MPKTKQPYFTNFTDLDEDQAQEVTNQVRQKSCGHCDEMLPLTQFNKNPYHNDGLESICKECLKIKRKQPSLYRTQNNYLPFYEKLTKTKECTICETFKSFEDFNKCKTGRYGLRSDCRKCQKEKYYENHEENLQRMRDWKDRNEKHLEEYRKKYYWENKEYIKEKKREWYYNNKEHLEEYDKRYYHENYKDNEEYKLIHSLRNRIYHALNGENKSESTKKLLGCSIKEFKKHLENQFSEGMSWENYGMSGWTIDHIIPCAAFDLTNEYAQAVCFHYSNCQPLWVSDNSSKNNNIPDLGIEIDKEWLQNRGIR